MTDTINLSPAHIVKRLDDNIIGQTEAKRAVALAFRSRWRRLQIENKTMRQEITPKNILMVGPTGVGKTEIARRLAQLTEAPFIKVEATKFTEVGYVGRDVDSIIRDLTDIGYRMSKKQIEEQYLSVAEETARKRVIDELGPHEEGERRRYELRFDAGQLDDDMLTTKIRPRPVPQKFGINIRGNNMPQMEQMGEQLRQMFDQVQPRKSAVEKRIKVAAAYKHFLDEELNKLVNENAIRERAIELVEESGIVFIDEIDKIAMRTDHAGDISRHGVQRDLLPLVEGTTVQTNYGPISTTHILFIASGAFHYSSPSDLVPELQGRLPVRVNLNSLTVEDFKRILSSTDYCLINQYQSLLATENVTLQFTQGAVELIAQIAYDVNERQENIGARRLHTIMEKLVEEVSFEADKKGMSCYKFNASTVSKALDKISKDEEASRLFL